MHTRLRSFCQVKTLQGTRVRLEPLSTNHLPDLIEAATPNLLRFHLHTFGQGSAEEVTAYLDVLLASAVVPFAIVDQASSRAVGVSTYMDVLPEHRQVEIGMTWIGERWQGTYVNPEAKFLMLQHAFEVIDCVRVQLKTDGRNLQSQRAIEKLGAKKEGVLRRHRVMPDGYIRDTVMYSILPEEWPAIRDALVTRIGLLTGQ